MCVCTVPVQVSAPVLYWIFHLFPLSHRIFKSIVWIPVLYQVQLADLSSQLVACLCFLLRVPGNQILH